MRLLLLDSAANLPSAIDEEARVGGSILKERVHIETSEVGLITLHSNFKPVKSSMNK